MGRHVQKYLFNKGYEVTALSRCGERSLILPEVRVVDCDILDIARCASITRDIGATHLLHLAWYTEPRLFWTSAMNLAWLSASLSLVSSFVEGGGRRVVSAGSCAEYDWKNSGHLLSEQSTPANPATLYGITKNSLNQVLSSYLNEKDISYAWGRLFFLYGVGEKPGRFMSTILQNLREGTQANLTSGVQRRDFMFTDDAARAFAELLDSPLCGDVNIGSGIETALAEVAVSLGRSLNRPELVVLGGLADNPNDPISLVADVQRLREELKFAPAFSLEQGLRAILESTE